MSDEYALNIEVDKKNKQMLKAIVPNKLGIECGYPTKYGVVD